MSQTARALPRRDRAGAGVRHGTGVFDLLLEPHVLRWGLVTFVAISLVLTRTSADFAAYVKSISSFLFP